MKTNSKIASALLISSLFLSSSLVAQKSMKAAQLDNSRKTQPLDTSVDTQPIHGDISAQDLESAAHAANYTRNPLHLIVDGHDFTIRGGEAGDACAILVGMELMAIPLLGGEELSIEPLAVVVQGQFDENGEFNAMIGYDGKMVGGYTFHLQAISYEEQSGKFWTSNVETLDFSGAGPASMMARGENDGDEDGDVDGSVDRGNRAPVDGDVDGDVDGGSEGDSDRAPAAGKAAEATKADTAGLDDGSVGTHN